MKRIAAVIVLLAAAGAAAYWWFAVRTVKAELVLSGSIESRSADVGPLVAGRIQEVFVDEGAHVAKGQSIASLEPDLIDPQIQEQEAQIQAQKAALDKALHGPRSEEISRARVEANVTETNRKRLESLLAQGIAPQQDYDAAAAQAKTALETLRELEAGTRTEDIASARAALAGAESRLTFLRRQREETLVRAPADGVIQSIDLRPGDLVSAGQPVVKILEPSQLWVRVYVPETRLGSVKQGAAVTIKVDTWPDRAFSGRIVEISDRAEYTPRNVQTLDQRGDQVFGVKVAIDPTPDLKPGMAAFVTLDEALTHAAPGTTPGTGKTP
jgi:multidrug resistance efflux pump